MDAVMWIDVVNRMYNHVVLIDSATYLDAQQQFLKFLTEVYPSF